LTTDCDLAIVGSGFGGSLLAMIARRLGYRVMLLERGRHPRFAIGESASPLAGVLIEQLADRYDLPRVRPLSAFGTWQRAYPDVVCGLKRGFTYFRHEQNQSYVVEADRSTQLLVAASPNDELSDTHWLRSDVDHFLVREAIATGVEYIDEIQIKSFERSANTSVLAGRRRETAVSIRAALVVDASGPHGFISRALNIRNRGFAGYPATQALFSHFTGVARCEELSEFTTPLKGAPYACDADWPQPPYPRDDAALHHVFDGGWMWVLRFGNGVTSAGIAVTDGLARELRLADGEPAWRRFLALYPSIAAQFANAAPTREFTWMPRLSWRAEQAAGPGWIMLPSAAGFVDPLFSTGIPLTLLGIERIARILESARGASHATPSRGRDGDPGVRLAYADVTTSAPRGPFDDYADVTLAEVDHAARFVAGCYSAFPRFEQFAAYSMFYFAAASHGEMSRRLNVHSEHARFLASDRSAFADALIRLSPQSRGYDACYSAEVAAAIEPINIAGLCDVGKRNWYGIDVMDMMRGSVKLGVTAEDVCRVCV
jgi:tetracycline 7-halogenase / FADH2 O2-dependent halogenase